MVLSSIPICGYTCSWTEVLLCILGVLVICLAGVVLYLYKDAFSPKKQPVPTYQLLKKQADAKASDRVRKAQQKSALEEFLKGVEKRISAFTKSITDGALALKNLNIKITGKQESLAALKSRLQKAEIEKAKLEREINELQLTSLLQQRATIPGKPGEEFFVRVKIEGETRKPEYQNLVRATNAFTVPVEMPKIDESAITWAFAANRQGPAVVVDSTVAKDLEGRLFFVGDIHGDVEALRRAIEYVFRRDAKAIMVFLGDLFDRGADSINAVRTLLWTAKRFPGQVLWLAGNHDIGLRYEESNGTFASDVEPSEFKDFLNAHVENKDEGLALIKIVKELPVACVIGNVWASHGGVPHNDVSGQFTSFSAMTQDMLDDCVWSRMKDVPAKLPNRSHRGAEVGYKNALQFFDVLKKTVGFNIHHIVCAHQHEHTVDPEGPAGYLQFKRYFKPETLSCQCIFTFFDKDHDAQPCILEYLKAEIPPQPHTI